MNNKKTWVPLLVLVFALLGFGGYVISKNKIRLPWQPAPQSPAEKAGKELPASEDVFTVRIFYPKGEGLILSEKKLPRRTKSLAIAEAVIEEYFRERPDAEGRFPKNVRLLGIYRDEKQVVYIDLSDELRRQFRGDALAEYLLLKGLFDSLAANVLDLQDVKVLIEGRELDTLGGHFHLKNRLRSLVAFDVRADAQVNDE